MISFLYALSVIPTASYFVSAAAALRSFECARNEWLGHPMCPNMDCTVSLFEYCKAASIGKLFDEYLTDLGFVYMGKMGGDPNGNTHLKVSLAPDTTSIFCSGLKVRRHLLSLMNSQDVERTGYAIDLLSLLEKTELHKAVYKLPFWPTSYHLGMKKQRRKFFERLPCGTQLEQPLIFKNNEHRGTGIIFISETDIIRKLFLRDSDQKNSCDPQKSLERLSVAEIRRIGFSPKDIDGAARIVRGSRFIAQQYLSNTLLIEGRKSGLRVFVVILSLNPFLVLFSEGYVSINAEVFDPADIRKANVLSNREVSAKAKVAETEWNWSFQRLGEYLEQRQNVTFDIDHVRRELTEATNLTLNAVVRDSGKFSKITRKKMEKYIPLGIERGVLDRKRDNNYLWLALDYLLTEDGEVKLLEFNLHPGTRFLDHCSWHNVRDPSYDDWQCQMGRNITKEIVDVSFAMAHRKKEYRPFITRRELEEMVEFHQVLIFKEF